MQTWICRSTGKIFLVKKDQKGLNPAVVEEFEPPRTPQKKEEAETLLNPWFRSQNPQLN
jgi:hypothetical protein